MEELSRLRERLKSVTISVVGDVCLDWYLFIDSSAAHVSVETGKTTRPVETSRFSPGGAGNVAANIRSLSAGTVRVFGVVGPDPFQGALRGALARAGVVSDLVEQHTDWHTPTYTKVYEDAEEDRRLDFGVFNRLEDAVADEVLTRLETQIPDCDVLVINQQLRQGIHTEYFRSGLCDLIRRHPDLPVITDSRDSPGSFHGTMRKLNESEAIRCVVTATAHRNRPAGRRESVGAREAAAQLWESWRQPVFVSRGADGCVVGEEGGTSTIPGVELLRPGDAVGAGDALLAGIACGFSVGLNGVQSAAIGNLVAAVTVAKKYETGSATLDEIEHLAADVSYRFNPELASGVTVRRFASELDVEIVTQAPTGRAFTSCIFDHDGTISTLRQGWEQIMEPMMVQAITGGRVKLDPSMMDAITRRVRGFIDATTGVQTLVQMAGLVEMVREFKIVPANEIRDPTGYKEIFNRQLLETVDALGKKLRRGILDTGDLAIKGSVEFLQILASRGVSLYLATGTDEADARDEAELLGYADIFGNRILGATGSISDEPKKRALAAIMDTVGTMEHVITFGDGPVEMRETRRRGGYAVGIASDEIRRYGWNDRKRSRLILAGADLLIPDFAEAEALADLIFPLSHQP